MGTETPIKAIIVVWQAITVKLNNPQMGTETTMYTANRLIPII